MPTANEIYQQAQQRGQTSFADEWHRTQDQLARLSAGQRAAQLGFSSLEADEYVPVFDALGQARMRIGHQDDGTVAITYANGPAPPVPSTPIVSARQLAVFVMWDGTFAGGYTAPADFLRIDVHMSTEKGFTPDGTTIVGTIPDAGGTLVAADNVTHFVKIVAVSHSKDDTTGKFVASAPTAEAAVLPLPATEIAVGAIGAHQLAADIGFLSRLVVGDPGASHLELEGRANMPPGMVLYDASGKTTFKLDALTGDVTIRGAFRTADAGARMTFNANQDNSIGFWCDNDPTHASDLSPFVFTWNGQQYAGIDMTGPWAGGNAEYARVELATYGATVMFGKASLNLQHQYASLQALNDAGAGGALYLSPTSASFGCANDYVTCDSNGPYLHAHSETTPVALAMGTWSWHWYQQALACDNNNCYVSFNASGIDIQQSNGNYLSVTAAGYATKPSARVEKTRIEADPHDFEQVVRGARSYRYEVIAERHAARSAGRKARKKIGPMADDVPAELVASFDDGSVGLWLDSQVGILWGATGAQSDRLDDLEARLKTLEDAR